MTTALIANGELDPCLASRIRSFSRIVAVDGGLVHCHRLQIQPDYLVGDLDSCPLEILSCYPDLARHVLPRDKDHTDLEIAVELELKTAPRLTLFAAWGGRIDHALAVALLLTQYPGKLTIETAKETIFALKQSTSLPCRAGQTLSLLPLNGPVTGITTSGLKWELKQGRLDASFTGISNVCQQESIHIEFERGSLLCWLEKIYQ